ncbi:MAG: putative aldo/keto reductase-like oxidoreductase [Candidatus Azotimanducaceae bacterium]|jgi:predicted aldo/keto reductase-like oxidoreductase
MSEAPPMEKEKQNSDRGNKLEINRRKFLQLGATTTLAGASLANASVSSTNPSSLKYVRLGRTELKISDISFGSSQLKTGQEGLVEHALNQGVNYFDTADSYTSGQSETVLGRALKKRRNNIIIATKIKAGAYTNQNSMMKDLDNSLSRLQTDHVEILFNHAVNDVSRLQNDEWFEFTSKAKKSGKIRYTGMSGHAGKLIECVDHAIDNDLVDVLLLSYNFGQDPAFYQQFVRSFDFVATQPDLLRVISKAKKNDLGVIGMKVLRGARLNDMRIFEKEGYTYAQAAFKWALSNTDLDATIISMTSKAKIDEYIKASGVRDLSKIDFDLLEQYARMNDMTYCRHACNDCEGACPYNVQIADTLRTRMYATDYQNLNFAKHEYAQLEINASACLSCDGKPCQNACTHGINISQLCGPTHLMLS